jgi:3-dehydroquinate dehydratase type I
MLCISIIPKDMEDLLFLKEKIGKRGDIIECRLDIMEEPDPKLICENFQRPLILTCRKREEGGLFKGEEGMRIEILRRCLNSGAYYVDVEMSTSESGDIDLCNRNTGLILSYHNLNSTPSRRFLRSKLLDGISSGADVVKIVTIANKYEDNLKVLSLIPEAKRLGHEIIAFCAGQKGRAGRVLSWLMGSKIAYVSLDDGGKTAPGQLTIDEMENLVRVLG